jgi:hypothetical protein
VLPAAEVLGFVSLRNRSGDSRAQSVTIRNETNCSLGN